ncbi:primary-amine oxidase [Plantibacter sp. YIM 135347]|uniref:primary-amine oxidase n=1 Tax=Plantibacter sp. YIM 135347 TaxID=3423919 RepID=UPI003D357AA3
MSCQCAAPTDPATIAIRTEDSILGARADHPLSSLSRTELEVAAEVLREAGLLVDSARIAYIGLDEPHKLDVLAWSPGDPLTRRARVQLIDRDARISTELLVDVVGREIVSSTELDAALIGQVPLLKEDHELIRELIAADERWRDALALRGIDDPSTVALAALSSGTYPIEGESGARMARILGHHQPTPNSLPWAHPVDGLVAYVDLGGRRVTQVIDTGVVPIPEESGDYHVPGTFGPERTTQRPIVIEQPEGPSFSLDGDVLTWEKWQLRLGYDMREGLLLHQLGFEDDGRLRPIIHRASIAEMLVPYGDPGPVRFWQNYFDTGEYLLGRLVNSLELGCDCVGDITYLDVALGDSLGETRILKHAICIHEEDAGVLWKHTEQFTGSSDVRRQRRLVISFFVTVGNYDYGFYWYLYLDGTIEFEAKATGIVFTAAYDERTSRWSSELAPGLAAPYHQHLFCARLDMAVDGVVNAVDEVDVTPVPMGPDNPYGNAIGFTATRLATEPDGRRRADNLVDRTWRISNTESTNRLGQPVSYVLRPEGRPTLMAHPDSVIASRARFATEHLWVTAYDPEERYPAGTIVNQSPGEGGLPSYLTEGTSIDGEDIVLWHTFGLTHFPRTEDWPIMPVDTTGFVLKPDNFFDRNPTLDVPASASGSACACAHEAHTAHEHHGE